MEAVQFHPTGIFPAGILVTEGCRGDGGLLKRRRRPPLHARLRSRRRKSSPRATSCRGAWRSTSKKGKGAQDALRRAPLARHHAPRPRSTSRQNLREVKEICNYFLGIDPVKSIGYPVRPAQHYTMGGVRTDHTGESPHAEGPVRGRRGGVLGHARLQPAGRQLGCRNGGRRHDRQRVHRGLLRRPRATRSTFRPAWSREFLRREQGKLDRLLTGDGSEEAASPCAWRCRRS